MFLFICTFLIVTAPTQPLRNINIICIWVWHENAFAYHPTPPYHPHPILSSKKLNKRTTTTKPTTTMPSACWAAKNLVTLTNWYSRVGRRKRCLSICYQKGSNVLSGMGIGTMPRLDLISVSSFLVFRKMSFMIHLNFSPLAGIIIFPKNGPHHTIPIPYRYHTDTYRYRYRYQTTIIPIPIPILPRSYRYRYQYLVLVSVWYRYRYRYLVSVEHYHLYIKLVDHIDPNFNIIQCL